MISKETLMIIKTIKLESKEIFNWITFFGCVFISQFYLYMALITSTIDYIGFAILGVIFLGLQLFIGIKSIKNLSETNKHYKKIKEMIGE